MINNTPRNTQLYRETTENSSAPMNHRTKYCGGCCRHRSETQFKTQDAEFCKQCNLRGITERRKTVRKP